MKRLFFVIAAIFLIPICSLLQAQRLFQIGNNGRFEAAFDPATCLLTITVRVKFSFEDGSRTNAWPNEAAKTTWKNDFIQGVQDHWSGKHRFKASRGNNIQGCETVGVRVVVLEVNSGEHFRIRVKKVKNHVTSSTGGGIVKLDSRDMEERERNGRKQTGAFHGFGHMIGLPDEHGSGTPSQMSEGNVITPNGYSPFEQALESLTNIQVDTI